MSKWVHPDDVRAIRRYSRSGYTITALAKQFKVSRQCVSGIVHYKTHANVTDDDAVPPLNTVKPLTNPSDHSQRLARAMERVPRP